jgi:hypothetical protein
MTRVFLQFNVDTCTMAPHSYNCNQDDGLSTNEVITAMLSSLIIFSLLLVLVQRSGRRTASAGMSDASMAAIRTPAAAMAAILLAGCCKPPRTTPSSMPVNSGTVTRKLYS